MTFSEATGETKVTILWQAHNASEIERKNFEEGQRSMQQGWAGTFEQLADYLVR